MSKPVVKIQKRKLQQYVQTNLTDFATLLRDPYSHTIELYDAIPKYVWGNQNRIHGKFLDPIVRDFKHKGFDYQATITPAAVANKEGEFKYYFPSQREELLEDALRKMASDGKGVYLEDKEGTDEYPMASVVFTLYELQQELKRMGHTYSLDQIKEGLSVCSNTGITLKGGDGTTSITTTLFETLGLESKQDVGNGKKTRCFVRFNLLVTQSIRKKNYRLLNYDTCMSYRRALARWFHKRMAHNYKQAGLTTPYSINLTTVIRDSGIGASVRLASALQRVETALDEMIEKGTVLSFEIERSYERSSSGQNKFSDAQITLTPGHTFVQDAIRANSSFKSLQKPLLPQR